MIVSELRLYNFRKFCADNGEPGLSISFHKGLNALIGENDSGKTAVIDALKFVLLTQSNDYSQLLRRLITSIGFWKSARNLGYVRFSISPQHFLIKVPEGTTGHIVISL